MDRKLALLGPDGRFLSPTRGDKSAADLTPSSMYGSFQGAQHSQDRGFIFLPTLDSQREVDQWSRIELMRRARFVYNSGGGLVHRCINGVARMVVGRGIWPHPMSKNEAWNTKRKALFMARARSRNTFDLSRKYNWVSGLQAIHRTKSKDGDMAVALAKDADGWLRCMFYEGNQIGTPATFSGAIGNWQDGVQIGPHREALAYEILTYDAVGAVTSVQIPAQDVLFQADFERPGQVRGLTKLYPVINRVLDRNEIQAVITKGIKVAGNVAYVVEQDLLQGAQPVPGAPGQGLPSRPIKLVETPDGKQVTLEQFLGGGEAWGLKPGQKFKIVQSENPHPNVSDHVNGEMVREIAWALKYAPEVLWNVIELGGANMRFIMADCQQQIEADQDELIEQFCSPYYLADTRNLIEQGELEDIDDWYLHGWTFPKRLTVDFTRDGKMYVDQYKRGMVTMKTLYGFTGDEWKVEADQYLDERQYIVQGVKNRTIKEADGTVRPMTMIEAYPELQQVAVKITEAGTDDNLDDDNPPSKKTKSAS